MKKIMKSIKIAFTILVMSSLNFACHSSSQEAVAPIDADVTTASAATEAKLTGEVEFWSSNYSYEDPKWIVKSYGNEMKTGNFGSQLDGKVGGIGIKHYPSSTKRHLHVLVFDGPNRTGKVTDLPPGKRGDGLIRYDFFDLGKKASSFSIYYSEN